MTRTRLPVVDARVVLDPERLGGSATMQRLAWPVVLVSMPFVDLTRPSIQLGLLKSITGAHGFPARTLHAHLDFAARIGADFYQVLCEDRQRGLGDWLFSLEAFGTAAPDPDGRYLDDFTDELAPLGDCRDEVRKRLRLIRHRDVPAYLDTLVKEFPWDQARVVGFTSTFQQNAASLALARRLKRRYPEIITVFGGANFDGDMGLELMRVVDCIDFAVIGEGDLALPRLLHALAGGTDPGTIPGIARRVGAQVVASPPEPPLRQLDDLPIPDYSEYFERAESLGLLRGNGQRDVWIPFEAARGCWWGAKHHCTFCGLNGSMMAFRSKSPRRVLDELAQQARRHGSFRFTSVDLILDMGYLKDLFPVLVEDAADYELFYEVKANLTRTQLRLLAQGGVTHIQPGIESLSSNVLRLMRKGVRAVQNVNLLRWARYYGIDVAWNILWGFPGETEQNYAEQAAVIPHLVHLQPPRSTSRIWMERFSPLYDDTAAVRSRAPERSYRYIYPRHVDLDRLAYFFDYELDNALPGSAYGTLRRSVGEWSDAWADRRPPVLKYWSTPGFLQIYDGRTAGQEGLYTFEGLLADVYRACSERPTTAAAVRERLGLDLQVDAVGDVFVEFQRRGLMFLDGSLALALALPAVAGR
jgi:ribosomal peptide maturation radical SAM protein 1